jgi:hypothetical protein
LSWQGLNETPVRPTCTERHVDLRLQFGQKAVKISLQASAAKWVVDVD